MAELTKDMLFNAGEGLAEADLMDLQRLARIKAWDYNRYAEAMAAVILFNNTSLYDAIIGSGASNLCYVHSPGLALIHTGGTLIVDLGAGMYGLVPRALDTDLSAMEMGFVDSGDKSFTHSSGNATNPRWDVISVGFANVDGASEARDFKDGTTGALTTVAQNKRRIATPTFTKTAGTPAASPVFPALPSGHRLVYAARINALSTQVDELRDYTCPMGQVRVVGGQRSWQALHSDLYQDSPTVTEASPGGSLVFLAGSNGIFLTPGDFFGDPAARVLGVSMHHDLASAGTVIELVRIESRISAVDPIVTVVRNITSLFTLDGTERVRDLAFNLSTASSVPIWCNGETVKGAIMNRSASPGIEGLALRIIASGGSDEINNVLWTIAR